MTQRINFMQQSPELFKKYIEFNNAVKASSIDETIRNLVTVRISQLNGCAFCLDMHVKQARIAGERELRLHHLASWRESTLFVPRERASLAWAEVLTRIPEQGASDEIYERVRTQLNEQEITDLTFLIMSSNAWSRLNIAFKSVPGASDAALGLDKAGLA
ncbi:carboxymuconolactone decarboxylase family protein [Roseateles sp. So40a]|uniref:carboxymuconolactone decarboxylase family protein n=1 Tax=Roseateles sp. So40a TaxID=3400226 RepID=UPI003A876B8E